MDSKSKVQGCLTILVVISLIGSVFIVYDNYKFDDSKMVDEWIYSTTRYNPYSMGGVIQKGNYPVNYLLKIDDDHTYKLYFGSPGFEEFETAGSIKKHLWEGVIFTNFNPKSQDQKDCIITNIVEERGGIVSFCIGNEENDNQCNFKFKRYVH